MTDYYNDGYLEAVLFLFYKDGKILVEHRPKGNSIEIFIPNGRIDTKDIQKDKDYKLVAMNREVYEEFSNKVKIKKFLPLGEFKVEEIKILFFGYLITEWTGVHPEYTVEDDEKFADLEWVSIEKYEEVLKLPSARFFVKEAMKIINKQTK